MEASRDKTPSCRLSVVTTAYNEAGNAAVFLEKTLEGLRRIGVSAEILYIDDGSTDGTDRVVREFLKDHHDQTVPIRWIRHPRRMGMTAAIQEAVSAARGEFLCLLPSDLESHPDTDIPLLYGALEDDVDMVVGVRRGRADGKVFASRIYNRLNRWLFGVRLQDANWIKLVRRASMAGLRLRSDWHRYLVPLLGIDNARIREVVTPWHPRTYGRSKFGLRRFPGAVADLITIKFLLTFGKRPLLFFGGAAAGFAFLAVAAAAAAATVSGDHPKAWIGALVLAGAAFTAAVSSLGLGLVAETILGGGRSETGGEEG